MIYIYIFFFTEQYHKKISEKAKTITIGQMKEHRH